MKSTIACLALVFLFLFVFVALSQTQQKNNTTQQYGHVVRSGETLWDIAERNLDAATAWESIYAENEFLHEPGRRSIDGRGRIIIKIYPGELLKGVNKETGAVADIPVGTTSAKESSADVVYNNEQNFLNSLLYLMILLLFLFLVGFWLYKKNPTQWRPMIPGGVREGDEAHILQALQRYGATLISGSQSKVRLSGIWGTKHYGIPVPVPHRYHQERAWRARFRMPNGTEHVGYMLQSCGNDVSAGAWYVPISGVKIDEGWGDESVTVAPPAPAHVPEVPPPTAQSEEEIVDDLVKFEVRNAHGDQSAMVRLSGINETSNNTVELRKGEIVIRYTPR